MKNLLATRVWNHWFTWLIFSIVNLFSLINMIRYDKSVGSAFFLLTTVSGVITMIGTYKNKDWFKQNMGTNEKLARELVSGVIIGAFIVVAMVIACMALYGFYAAAGHITLGVVHHFGPSSAWEAKCISFCAAEQSSVAEDTPKIFEHRTHYCRCEDGKEIWANMSAWTGQEAWEIVFNPKKEFKDF